MRLGIIDIGMGNITSVKNALAAIDINSELVNSPEKLEDMDYMILPGVGAFPEAISRIKSKSLDEVIYKNLEQGKKLLGICLGMQLLFSQSSEFGINEGLNIIDGDVLPFSEVIDEIIPHMGWNEAISQKKDFEEYSLDYYFVHSFYCKPKRQENELFRTNYGIEFCSGVIKDDQVFGIQFHPEKSQTGGLRLLKRLINPNA